MTEQDIRQEYENYKDDDEPDGPSERLNIGDSPCSGCPREFQDKNICADACLRLKAFQYNKPYEHLPYYPEAGTSPQIEPRAQEPPKTIKTIIPKMSWKKIFPENPPAAKNVCGAVKPVKKDIKSQKPLQKVAQKPKVSSSFAPMTDEEKLKITRETSVCLVCARDKSKYPLRRGLCVSRCSGAWREGRITHPLLGEWKEMSQKDVHRARWGVQEECLIEGCNKIGNRRGLCENHYRQWITGVVKHPEFGEWFAKRQKKKKDEKSMTEDPVEYEVGRKNTKKDGITSEMLGKLADEAMDEVIAERAIAHSVSLDFTHYQKIYGALEKQAELSKLPLGHVIMNVLSLGLMSAQEKEKRSGNENNS